MSKQVKLELTIQQVHALLMVAGDGEAILEEQPKMQRAYFNAKDKLRAALEQVKQ